jgi:hypothetical protein
MQALPPGKATIRYEFAYDGGGIGKGGTATLFVIGKKVATGRIEKTQCCAFSTDEGADVGRDNETKSRTTTRRPTTSSPARSGRSRSNWLPPTQLPPGLPGTRPRKASRRRRRLANNPPPEIEHRHIGASSATKAA